MPRVKTLYLTDKAFDLLAGQENASQYVSKLIESSTLAISEDLIAEKKETQAKVEILAREVEKIDKQIIETEEDQKDRIKHEKLAAERMKSKLTEKIKHIKKSLKEQIIRDPTDLEVNECLDLFEKGETNIFKFSEVLKQRDFEKDTSGNPLYA